MLIGDTTVDILSVLRARPYIFSSNILNLNNKINNMNNSNYY
jgi:hypothetical protein